MRILPNYIARSFLATLVAALLVLNFVMSVGLIFKVTQYIARGMSLELVLDFLRGGIPGTLSYSIPIAILVSSLLVFGRLSTDSEISAMRSSGIGIWQIMRAPLLISAFLAVICLHINNNVSPQSAYIRSSMRGKLKATDVTALIEPGKYVDIGPHSVYVGALDDGLMRDMRIIETDKKGFIREIRAREAVLTPTNDTVHLHMRDVTIDPASEPGSGIARAERLVYTLGSADGRASKAENERPRRVKDKYSWMLVKDLIIARDHPPATPKGIEELSRARAELSSRMAFALSCVCFALIGVPLGMKQQRRESSLGVVLCLAIAGAFYLFEITAESLSKNPAAHASWIAWAPVAICVVVSIIFARRSN
jgi:Predicted permeases